MKSTRKLEPALAKARDALDASGSERFRFAVRVLTPFVPGAGDHAEFQLLYGYALYRVDRDDEALRFLERAQRLATKRSPVAFWSAIRRAQWHHFHEEVGKSRECLREARAHLPRGSVHLRAELEFNEARSLWQRKLDSAGLSRIERAVASFALAGKQARLAAAMCTQLEWQLSLGQDTKASLAQLVRLEGTYGRGPLSRLTRETAWNCLEGPTRAESWTFLQALLKVTDSGLEPADRVAVTEACLHHRALSLADAQTRAGLEDRRCGSRARVELEVARARLPSSIAGAPGQRARRLRRAISARGLDWSVLLTGSRAFLELGDIAAAAKLCHRVLEGNQPRSVKDLARVNLSGCALLQTNFEAAERWLAQIEPGELSDTFATIYWLNSSTIAFHHMRFAEAEALARSAVKTGEGVADPVVATRVWLILGQALLATDQGPEALEAINRARALVGPEDWLGRADSHLLRAFAMERLGRPRDALLASSEAARMAKHVPVEVRAYLLSQAARLQAIHGHPREARRCIRAARRLPVAGPAEARARSVLSMAESALGADVAAARDAERAGTIYEAAGQLMAAADAWDTAALSWTRPGDKLRAGRMAGALVKRALAMAPTTDRPAVQEQLRHIRNRLLPELLEQEFVEEAYQWIADSRLTHTAGRRSKPIGRICAALEDDEAVVELAVVNQAALMFVFRKSGPSLAFCDWADQEQRHLATASGILRGEIGGPETAPFLANALRALWSTLIGPLQPKLQGATTVWLAPGTQLASVPFEALLDSEDRMWSHRVALGFLSSGLELLRAPRTPAVRSAVVLRGEDVETGVVLGAADDEFGALVKSLQDAKVEVAAGATSKQQALRLLRGTQLFHYGGHARYGSHGVDSELLTTVGSIVASDFEAGSLPRRPLVVLAGCETGRAHSAGDAQFGFVSSLVNAGASGVVSASWNADDRAASALMKRFYTSFLKGNAPVIALSEAARRLADDEPGWAHPLFTANFRCYLGRG